MELEGKGYTAFVQAGDAFKQGDVLVQFDQTFIQDKGYSTITPIVVTNTADFTDVIVHEENKDIQQGDLLLSIFQ